MRNAQNKEMLREGNPYGVNGELKPCVCVLDDRHIDSELELAEYNFSNEVPTKDHDLRALISRLHLRTIGGGKCTLGQFEPEIQRRGKANQETAVRNFIEDDVVSALDRGCLVENIRIWMEAAWSCRKRTYATFRAAPGSDDKVFVGPIHKGDRVYVCQRKKQRLPKAPSGVLSQDTKERPVEFALYAQHKILKLDGKRMSEFEAWQLEGLAPKPEPVDLSFNSSDSPEMYIWEQNPKAESKPIDQSNPYGSVAVLNSVDVSLLNERRKGRSHGENI